MNAIVANSIKNSYIFTLNLDMSVEIHMHFGVLKMTTQKIFIHCILFPLYCLSNYHLEFVRLLSNSQTPEIETANLSQPHASLNLSHFLAYCLFHRNSTTTNKNN